MTVYIFDCSTDSNVKLLVPTTQIPTEAMQDCKGTWNYAQQGTWESPRVLHDFEAGDTRLAIDSAKAVQDIQTQGFHIARVAITAT